MRLVGWRTAVFMTFACIVLLSVETARARTENPPGEPPLYMNTSVLASDSLAKEAAAPSLPRADTSSHTAWGIDILLSNNGFGLGGFHRREITDDLSGFITLSISEAKDDREVEMYDPIYGISYTPGKLNRFLVMPLMVGLQYRIFREDIMDSFRPYLNAGVGPTMVFSSPYTDLYYDPVLGLQANQVDFFKSLGRGQAHYTAGAFVGFGANFGTERSNLLGINVRYYFTYLFGDGLPSLYNITTGAVTGTKKDFGGFFITFNIGVGY